MELFGTLVLILSAIKTLRSRLVPNSFPKQVPWSNSIKTLLQSSTETSEWLPDRFQSRDRFHSRESLYIMRRVQSSQDLFVHQYDRSFIVLYTNMAGGGGGEVGDFFFMWKQQPLFFIDPPSGEGTARPQTQQSLISYTAILCAVTERSSPLREGTKNS